MSSSRRRSWADVRNYDYSASAITRGVCRVMRISDCSIAGSYRVIVGNSGIACIIVVFIAVSSSFFVFSLFLFFVFLAFVPTFVPTLVLSATGAV